MLPISFVSSFLVRFTAGLLFFFFFQYVLAPSADFLFVENAENTILRETIMLRQSEKERLFEYLSLAQWVMYICLIHAGVGIYHVFEEYLDVKNVKQFPLFRILTAFLFLITCFLFSIFF